MIGLDLQYTTGPDTWGSGLVGYMRTTYDKIVDVLGDPHYIDEDNKVSCEWAIRFVDGPLVTIYDYKEKETPMGEYDWHIGGINKNSLVFIKALFESAGVNVQIKE